MLIVQSVFATACRRSQTYLLQLELVWILNFLPVVVTFDLGRNCFLELCVLLIKVVALHRAELQAFVFLQLSSIHALSSVVWFANMD